MSEWQPIETAPKIEDKPVVLLLSNGVPIVASWVPADAEANIYGREWWDIWIDLGAYGLPAGYDPTHWMPLPDPPSHIGGER